MAATIAAMAMINAKCFNSPKLPNPTKQIPKPTSLLSLQNLPKGLAAVETTTASSIAGTAVAGAVFAALSGSDAAMAAQQIAEIAAEGDNRGLALLLPLVPAIAGGDNRGQLLLFVVAPAILWVLYNILQPALNQLNRMRSE
ncbi:photosystem II core complex proteins psbY, chloroplastic-like [Senna tora]|uniref:Photosystem II core complex proteins psbY, chloroplastic-like n=1 Tax=Senna tora TaxID=362788 RepID=A0A834T1N8_9FABA|nr:photosystem II core complex proteins psbY, chloroplastic-like [Senna tora]